MVNPILVDMLVRKIKDAEINPNTGQPFQVVDIKIDEYKTAVEAALNQ